MNNMFCIAEQQGIDVEWHSFKAPIRGLYWAPETIPPVIWLDHSLENNQRLMRSVMAEELGHHFTLDRYSLCRTYYNYRDRLNVSRAEYRALRWAAYYLMPLDRLEQAFKRGIFTRWELAEEFNITEDLVPYRLAMPDVVRALYGSGSHKNQHFYRRSI